MNIIDEQINLTLKNFIFENITNEANNNLPIHEFDNDMKKLGFIKDYDRAGSRVIYKLKDGGLKITTHYPGKTAKADMLRNVFDNLIKIKWFDNPDNFNIFPFDRWGFNPNSINIDTTKQDILKANEIYQNAEVYRVFYNTPNKLCVLHTNEGYNLCRDINDKRPLLDKWYNGFEQGNVPKLKLDNYETMQTEVYPINQDGTLDTKNITLENKKLNIMSKKLIRLTEGDLHRIIKESVNNILKENDFEPHGYKTTSNLGGNEIQISNSGDAARIRDSHTGNITDWLEIEFDEEGVAYVTDEMGNQERLCDYMRY